MPKRQAGSDDPGEAAPKGAIAPGERKAASRRRLLRQRRRCAFRSVDPPAPKAPAGSKGRNARARRSHAQAEHAGWGASCGRGSLGTILVFLDAPLSGFSQAHAAPAPRGFRRCAAVGFSNHPQWPLSVAIVVASIVAAPCTPHGVGENSGSYGGNIRTATGGRRRPVAAARATRSSALRVTMWRGPSASISDTGPSAARSDATCAQ